MDIDKDAIYNAAVSGKKHGGVLAEANKKSDVRLKKSFGSHSAQVDEHWKKLQSPEKYDAGWNEKTETQKNGLLKKWKKDMQRNAEQAAIEEKVLRERGLM